MIKLNRFSPLSVSQDFMLSAFSTLMNYQSPKSGPYTQSVSSEVGPRVGGRERGRGNIIKALDSLTDTAKSYARDGDLAKIDQAIAIVKDALSDSNGTPTSYTMEIGFDNNGNLTVQSISPSDSPTITAPKGTPFFRDQTVTFTVNVSQPIINSNDLNTLKDRIGKNVNMTAKDRAEKEGQDRVNAGYAGTKADASNDSGYRDARDSAMGTGGTMWA